MEEIKNNKFYIFLFGIGLGVSGTIGVIYSFYDFKVFYESLKNTSSEYIKKNEINSYLEKKDKVILNKDSYILKTNIKNYIEKNNNEIISKKNKEKLMKTIDSLEVELLNKNKVINNLNQFSKNEIEKTYYAYDFEDTPIYFVKDTNKIDLESRNIIEQLKNMKLHKSIAIKIEPCENKYEEYNETLGAERISLIKNILIKFINPRKIRINKENIVKPICSDPDNKYIINEKNENLALGMAIIFTSEQ